MRTNLRRADEHLRWLRAVVKDGYHVKGLSPLAALTGTDHKALEAIDRCWALYAYDRSDEVLHAVALLARRMQASTRPFARELIARAMDWGDRDRYWPLVLAKMGSAKEFNDAVYPQGYPFSLEGKS